MKKIILPLLFLSLFPLSAFAERCSVNFNYGVIIDPTHVRFLEKGHTSIQINGANQLFVGGREISLSEQQKELLTQYTKGIRAQVPMIVAIAIEGVEIGLKAVNTVIGSLTGENSTAHQKIQEKFDDLQMRLHKRFNHSDESYYIAPQDFAEFDQIFTGEFEQEIEEIISTSIGTILLAVGEAISTENNEENEERAETFDEKIANLGQDLDFEIGKKAKALENKAEMFCHKLIKLNKIEDQLQIEIPQLTNFNLIESSSSETKTP